MQGAFGEACPELHLLLPSENSCSTKTREPPSAVPDEPRFSSISVGGAGQKHATADSPTTTNCGVSPVGVWVFLDDAWLPGDGLASNHPRHNRTSRLAKTSCAGDYESGLAEKPLPRQLPRGGSALSRSFPRLVVLQVGRSSSWTFFKLVVLRGRRELVEESIKSLRGGFGCSELIVVPLLRLGKILARPVQRKGCEISGSFAVLAFWMSKNSPQEQ